MSPPLHNSDQTVQDTELQLEFDAICKSFVAGLEAVEIGILECKDGNVEDNDQNAHANQMSHHVPMPIASGDSGDSQEFYCCENIKARYDQFLKEEDCHLDLFPY